MKIRTKIQNSLQPLYPLYLQPLQFYLRYSGNFLIQYQNKRLIEDDKRRIEDYFINRVTSFCGDR